MQIDPWTLAFQAINFLVLAWLLQRFLYRPIRRIIDQRRAAVSQALTDAEAAQRHADEQAADYGQRMSAIDEKREQVLSEARAEIEEERKAILLQARSDAEAIHERQRLDMDAERRALAQEVREEAAGLAVDLAERLLADATPRSLAETFVGRLEERLSAMTPEQREGLFGAPGERRSVDVATAPPLDPATQARCRDTLASLLGGDCHVRFSEAPELIAGARLRFPTANLEISWAATLQATRKDLAAREATG